MPTSHAARKENWEVGWVFEGGGEGGVSGLDQRPGTIKPETRDLQRVSVGKCLHLHDCFFQIGGWCVVSSRKILMLLHFVWKLVINKTRKHKNQRTVLHIYSFRQMTFWRKCERKNFYKFHRNSLNSWKCATEERYSTYFS